MQLPALITSDWHLVESPSAEYRWGIFPWLAKMIKEHHVRTLLILGDLTDAKDNHSAELVNRIVAGINSLPIDSIRILAGNHDWLKRGQEYFRFLNLLPKVTFITKPWEDDETHGPLAYFLPYSKDPVKEWADMDFSHYDYLFLHQTVAGAVSSNGQKMDGEKLPALNALRVISGDIHVPQQVKNLTYVGSPYHVHFGDDFKPRCILIGKDRAESSLHFKTIKRVAARVASLQALYRLDLTGGDQIKLSISLDESEKHGWSKIRRVALEYLAGLKVDVHGIELIVVKANRRVLVGADTKRRALSAPEAVLRFVEHEELGGTAYDSAMTIMESK